MVGRKSRLLIVMVRRRMSGCKWREMVQWGALPLASGGMRNWCEVVTAKMRQASSQ